MSLPSLTSAQRAWGHWVSWKLGQEAAAIATWQTGPWPGVSHSILRALPSTLGQEFQPLQFPILELK